MTFSPHPYCSRNLTSCIPLFRKDEGEGGKCQPPLLPSPPRPPYKKKEEEDIKGASVCRDRVSIRRRGWGSGGCWVSGKEQAPELLLCWPRVGTGGPQAGWGKEGLAWVPT